MKITRVEAIPIRIPLKTGLTTKTAHGEHIDSPYVIVRVHTDQGLVGLGEATLAPRWSGETSESCVAAIATLLSPTLEGTDPQDVTARWRQIDGALRANPFTKAAVEMALWDLAGKAAGVPVYRLLGGKVRDQLPIKMVVGAFEVPKAVALAERFLEWGAVHLKVKVGLDPVTDIARVRAVREVAGPEVTLGVDGNCGWDLPTAKRSLKAMEEFDLRFAEQLVGTDDADDLVQLRAAANTPVMADESAFTPNDAWHLTAARAVDVLAVYPGKNAGVAQTMAIAGIAEASGVACCMGSNLELGIATAAMLHAGVAAPAILSDDYPGDYIGPLYHEADMIEQPLELGPRMAVPPEGPGLGVTLDEKQLDKWRVD